jgi:lysyl-tRNA synthetase class 2
MSPEFDPLFLRAFFLKKVRQFFDERAILEVDSPILKPFADIDTYIEPIEASGSFLHTSPEYEMKKLLAKYRRDLYFLGHVFRKEEKGAKHKQEFTMIEWYRIDFSFEQMIQETLALIQLFVDEKTMQLFTYQQLFKTFLNIDPFHVKDQALKALLKPFDIQSINTLGHTDLLHLCFAFLIEPKLENITVIYDYPENQAMLSQIENNRAKRFEVIIDGMEIANGFKELKDPAEQKRRFEQTGKTYAIDPDFLKALEQLPNCCGVAVGFDRLLMLHAKQKEIDLIYP